MDRESIQERFGIVGSSPALRHVIDRVRQVARTDITVLIQGESGVGKELFAEALHHLSSRRHESMVVVNCGAIPEGLIESELFGAEKGAYTGATAQRTGYFEEADGGTIFLDEVGEMPQAAQVRLLRILESGRFSRVGWATVRTADVRVIAATNKDLAREVEAGRFREDLYYRLSTVLVSVPPLRERHEDILPLVEHFLHRFARKYNSPMKRLTRAAEEELRRYRWPGNVRELKNVAEQAVVLLRSEEVTDEDLRPYLRGVSAGASESLVPVARGGTSEETSERDLLLYRAMMGLQVEIREMKEQLRAFLSNAGANVGVAVPRKLVERGDFPGERDDYVIVPGRQGEEGYPSFIEDVVYEVEDEPPAAPPEVAANGHGAEEPLDEEPADDEAPAGEPMRVLPTLEEAEHQLISEALKRFDGNRRQTAQALGISERTLYRKLKELDEDL